mmetsp:Transcript_5557/g.8256  ORF Transcript_5557/g.8256 Transcript_5557/m.8256 type:complete len:149 (+) Transcript_5557:19-465(+)
MEVASILLFPNRQFRSCNDSFNHSSEVLRMVNLSVRDTFGTRFNVTTAAEGQSRASALRWGFDNCATTVPSSHYNHHYLHCRHFSLFVLLQFMMTDCMKEAALSPTSSGTILTLSSHNQLGTGLDCPRVFLEKCLPSTFISWTNTSDH